MTGDRPRRRLRVAHCLLVVLLLAGCTLPRGSVKLAPGTNAHAGTIAIVPIEAAPLEMSENKTLAVADPVMPVLAFVQPGAFYVVAFVGSVPMLVEMAATSKALRLEAGNMDDALARAELWGLTVVLADSAATRLRRSGRKVVVSREVVRLPVENRERTFFGENWQRPLRQWFNEEKSRIASAGLQLGPSDRLLEVGILNYSYFNGQLLVRVAAKLVDPSTKAVLGVTRHWRMVPAGTWAEPVADDGQRFRDVFSRAVNPLMAQALADLDLR